MSEAPHGLDVLRKHLDPGVDHRLDVRAHALEVRRQRLDGGMGAAALDGAHARGIVRRAAVGEIVAVDGGEHDIAELHELHGARGVLGLLRIEPAVRVTGVDGAEAAGARAHRSHQHQGRRPCVPALPDVGALGFLADRGEPMLTHQAPDAGEPGPGRRPGLQPRRQPPGDDRGAGAAGGTLDAITYGGKALRRQVFLAAPRAGRCGDD